MSNLISTSYAKAYMRITSSGTDDLIDQIVAGVSGQVERDCARKFNEATYRQWLDGDGGGAIRLPQYPITRLYRAATQRLCIGNLTYTGSDTVATAGVSSSGVMTLANITSSGAESFKDITLADKSLSELSTSVAGQTGWAVSITGSNSTQSVRDLKPFSDWSDNNSNLQLIIPCESARARVQSETEDTVEIVQDEGWGPGGGGVPHGHSNVFVWWKAGYATIPTGLQQVTAEIVKLVFDATTHDASVSSEKIGDYAYSLNTAIVGQTVSAFHDQLSPWCRHEL